ncbi:MAP3K12-binding inhibitory protein 1 isoform X2 [Mixophyes fleayi]|uniref:MAP3K12-binding inhibitory protein 1 isoform X2 n=1 Tax=Mixophyes fleayi TaxID=3061075 RepID=UPI003F4D96ED
MCFLVFFFFCFFFFLLLHRNNERHNTTGGGCGERCTLISKNTKQDQETQHRIKAFIDFNGPFLDRLQSLSNGNGEKSVGLERAEESHCTLDVIEPKERVDADIASKLTTNNVLVDSNCVTNPAAVQIQARKSEIDRRILAFIERKQAEINENNVREFCNVIDCNQENSCARTDAVFTPFPGFKSHVKVSRVLNAYGPQTRTDSSASSSRAHSLPQESGNQAVEERLQNIECHLRLKQGGPVPTDIYQRIKKLEDRILELEGISPEYFQSMDASSKRKKVQASQNYSLVELDQKINALRQTLIQKSKRETSRTDIVLA